MSTPFGPRARVCFRLVSGHRIEVEVTDYGYRYFGIRPLGESQYVRGYHVIMPFTQLRPPGPDKAEVHGHYWVPMDDETCMVWNFYYSYGKEPIADRNGEGYSGNAYGSHVDPQTFKPYRNRSNNWMIDRRMQKCETFTGIDGINQQDRAVQESMGPIVDRTRENLGPGDRAVVMTRKLLLEAIDSVQRGEVPRGVSPSYYEVRAAEAVLSKSENWWTKLLPRMQPENSGVPADQIRPEPNVLEDAAP